MKKLSNVTKIIFLMGSFSVFIGKADARDVLLYDTKCVSSDKVCTACCVSDCKKKHPSIKDECAKGSGKVDHSVFSTNKDGKYCKCTF